MDLLSGLALAKNPDLWDSLLLSNLSARSRISLGAANYYPSGKVSSFLSKKIVGSTGPM